MGINTQAHADVTTLKPLELTLIGRFATPTMNVIKNSDLHLTRPVA